MRRMIALLTGLVLALAACSNQAVDDIASEIDSATDASVADEVERNAIELAAEVEQEMDVLAEEIQASEAAADLKAAWGEVQAEVTAAIATMQTDGTITTDGLEQELEAFQAELDWVGDAVAPELKEAWSSLRTKIEQMMA